MEIELAKSAAVAEPVAWTSISIASIGLMGICWNGEQSQGMRRGGLMLEGTRCSEAMVMEVIAALYASKEGLGDFILARIAKTILLMIIFFVDLEAEQEMVVAEMSIILVFHLYLFPMVSTMESAGFCGGSVLIALSDGSFES